MSEAHDQRRSAQPARIARRVAALVYDLMLLGALLFMFTLAVFIVRGRAVAPGTLWFQLCLAAIVVWFFTWFWVHGGQTLGMKAWRLRLIDTAGRGVGWRSALIRFGAGVLAAVPAGLGLWWAAFDRERRAWHDRVSRTRVVHEPRESAKPHERDRGDDE